MTHSSRFGDLNHIISLGFAVECRWPMRFGLGGTGVMPVSDERTTSNPPAGWNLPFELLSSL